MINFKPGDWVIITVKRKPYTHLIKIIEILQETETDYAVVKSIDKEFILDGRFFKIELWQPKPEEWCWFWDTFNFDAPILSRFCNMKDNLFTCTNSKQSLFTHCEPFIGQLPTILKDK